MTSTCYLTQHLLQITLNIDLKFTRHLTVHVHHSFIHSNFFLFFPPFTSRRRLCDQPHRRERFGLETRGPCHPCWPTRQDQSAPLLSPVRATSTQRQPQVSTECLIDTLQLLASVHQVRLSRQCLIGVNHVRLSVSWVIRCCDCIGQTPVEWWTHDTSEGFMSQLTTDRCRATQLLFPV